MSFPHAIVVNVLPIAFNLLDCDALSRRNDCRVAFREDPGLRISAIALLAGWTVAVAPPVFFAASPALAQAPGSPATGSAAELQAAGVAAARAGRHAEGLRLLQQAAQAAPQDRGIQADQVVVLMWAGRDREALARFAQMGEAEAPGYALAAAAVAARRTGKPAQAAQLYRRALDRGEANDETRIGLALAEAARGDRNTARDILKELQAQQPDNARIRAALAQIDRPTPVAPADPAAAARRVRELNAAGDPEAAVSHALQAGRGASSAGIVALADQLLAMRRPVEAIQLLTPWLAQHPNDRPARRMKLLAVAASGAPELALEESRRYPGVLGQQETRRLESGAAAFLVRWGSATGMVDPRDPSTRFALTDRSIAALEAAIANWQRQGPEAAPMIRNARLDRLVALRDRGRMREAIAEAEALRAEAPLPGYARQALGDAYLRVRQPALAEAEYRAVLAEDADSLFAQLGLFYALTDQRRWSEAQALAQRLDSMPAFRATRDGQGNEPEWDRVATATAAVLYRLYSDDYAGAEERVNELVAAAPANSNLRALRSDIWRMRGWHEQALEEAETATTDDPVAVNLRLSRAEALLDLRRWREAGPQIAALVREYPENRQVERLARRWELHNRYELESEGTYGLTRGGGSFPELLSLNRLYSPPIAWDWRGFVGGGVRAGRTPEGYFHGWRSLAGLEYRSGPVTLRGGVTYDFGDFNRGGGFVEAAWRINDQWRLEASGESQAFDTPLRALRNRISAGGGGITLSWRQHELREASVQFRALGFSDGNTRLIGFAQYTERVLNLPDFRLDITPYVYTTSNSHRDAPYFNPRSDVEAGGTAAATWIVWRRFESDFRIRLAGTVAGYWQQGFGWSPLYAVKYEHIHNITDALMLSYGATFVRRDYDGVATDSLGAFWALRWRF